MNQRGKKLQRHPWDEWLLKKKGQQTVVVKGRDFNCQTYAMTIQIRAAARRRNRRVSLHTSESLGGSVIVITIKGRRKK